MKVHKIVPRGGDFVYFFGPGAGISQKCSARGQGNLTTLKKFPGGQPGGDVGAWNLLMHYANQGYQLEVDVRYHKELHDLHNDLPFMCKNMVINGVEKLISNLDDKRNYIVHVKALNQALFHGLVLGKVH